ncbi:MAG: gliding motility-associated C-terminal domain-containing protein [Sphingobacteriales bacterium]|nr:gliding motility-associated C-terminal domain-containing protein [Sphingobacteriales bacterium]
MLNKLVKYLFNALVPVFIFYANAVAQNGFATNGKGVTSAGCNDVLFSGAPSVISHTLEVNGSAWYRKQIDLTQPFQLGMVLYFQQTIFTDGFVFALTDDATSLGGMSNTMGWGGIKKSIAVTFDLKSNTKDNDPAYAHAAIQLNGNTNHQSADNIAGPVSIQYLFNSLSKLYEYAVFSWQPATQTLSVTVNGSVIISAQYDIAAKIFNGNNLVYWGFTGSLSQYTSMSNIPADARPAPGYIKAYFGTIIPRFESSPELDTCFGKPIIFKDDSRYESDGTFNSSLLAKWYWDFGDGTTSAIRNPPAHNYPAPGKYTFKFTVTNQIGCTVDTLMKVITLGSTPKVDFDVDALCAGRKISFTDKSYAAVSGGIIKWQWDFNSEFLSDKQHPALVFQNAGEKKIKLEVRTIEGCVADTEKILELGMAPVIDFSLVQDCDRNVFYTSVLKNNVTVKNRQWDFGDDQSSSDPNPVHMFQQNVTYKSSLLAVSADNCPSDTIVKEVIINKIVPNAGNDTIITKGQPLQLLATGADSYLWFPAIGLNNDHISNPVAVLNKSQTYTVQFKNSNGCIAYDTISVKVFDKINVYVPSVFTPNNDGLNDVLHIIAPGIKRFEYFKIYDRWGKQVFVTKDLHTGWDGTYNKQQLPSGNYVWFLYATDYRGNSISGKGIVTILR